LDHDPKDRARGPDPARGEPPGPDPGPPQGEEPESGSGARKAFLLRLPPDLHAGLKRLAGRELRSLNGQIELLLREALRRR